MQPLFNTSSYDTPTDKPRFFLDRLALNTRFVFVAGVVNVINNARILANKGCYDNKAWLKSSTDIVKIIEGCGGKFHLRGLDNISSCREPVVFISNHMSTLETFVFPCLITPFMNVTFVVKDSLVKHPFFGSIMRSRNPIVVTRDNPREDFKIVMEKGKELLKKGTSVIIFPQSTRALTFEPENFNSLGIKLAKAAGVKVIPVAIKTDFWGNGKILKDLGPISRNKHIYMNFGEPFSIKGSGKEEHQFIVDFIQANLNEWKNT
ncbi:MAG: lysophospholipid acyltransferase family protein [Desulfitobacterium hafniense]|nr:lysophospholipid acyltransferase family protein [Desulfitobacterium hafniense]